MWLVLCSCHDLAGLWVFRGVSRRAPVRVELVTAEVLAHGLRWEHRLGKDPTAFTVDLADGRSIHGHEVSGCINRIVDVPAAQLELAVEDDRDYASQELVAFFLSWLAGLPGAMLNRPTPQGLCGRWRPLSEWTWLASRAGLPVPHYAFQASDVARRPEAWASSHVAAGGSQTPVAVEPSLASRATPAHTVFVVGGRPVGSGVPDSILEGCVRLAARSGTELLGIDLSRAPSGELHFAGASPLPELRHGGEAVIDALVATLEQGEVRTR